MAAFEEYGKRLLDFGIDRWHSSTGLAIMLAGIVVVGVATFAGIDITAVSSVEWALIAIAILFTSLAWFTTRIPRVSRGRVGFGVAIDVEHSDHATQLRADFVVTLQQLLNGSQHRHRFHFIDFSQAIARRTNSRDRAVWLVAKSRCHLLLYGRARLRAAPQGQAHVLDLSWVVTHKDITLERSSRFATDVGSVFPHRLIVGPAGDMFVCEFGAQLVDAVARYIIGTAAALSDDFEYAEQLLADAERKLAAYVRRAESAPIAVLLDRVRKRILELSSAWLTGLSRQYSLKRDKNVLAQSEQVVLKLRAYDPDNYGGHLTAAMAAFLLRRDLEAAKRELAACRQSKDATWMYGEAFLIAYDGDLERAYRLYRRAFESPLADLTVPMQCEEFIQSVIDEEPHRKWLYYCLGLINHRAKGDLTAARSDFARFIGAADSAHHERQMQAAREWIREIDAALGSEATLCLDAPGHEADGRQDEALQHSKLVGALRRAIQALRALPALCCLKGDGLRCSSRVDI